MTEAAAAVPSLGQLVESLADNKYSLGRRYAEWCTAAPTLESAVAAAAMAQDEIGHARSLYPLLRDLVGNSPEVEPETRTVFCNVPFLDNAFEGWTDFIAANFLFDTAMTMLLEAARESSSTELGQRARRMLEEEPLHWLHGEGWTRRLAEKDAGVRAALQESFRAITQQTLDWFNIADNSVVDGGILAAGADTLRQQYRERINPVLKKAGLSKL